MSPLSRSLASLTGLLALLTACVAPGARGDAGGLELTLLTYNIHHGRGADGVIDLERQAEVILATGADLVALQEVDVGTGRSGGVDQASELGRLTGMHVIFAEAMPYDGGSYGEALLSRWPILRAETWPLSASPGREPRAAVVAVVEPPGLGHPVRVVGTHLDHLDDEGDRMKQTAELLSHMEGTDRPTVLLGDLNAEPDSGPIALLSLIGWRPADSSLAPTYPAVEPDVKIDWVLLDPHAPGELTAVEVLHEPVASDHAPLRAVWRL